MSRTARFYIASVDILGFALVVHYLAHWHSPSLWRYFCYFLIGGLTAGLKVALPGVTGTLSVNFVFILFSVVELTGPETVLLACSITAVQCFWHAAKRPRTIQVLFSVAAVGITSAAADSVYHFLERRSVDSIFSLVVAGLVFFALNTGLISAVIALTEHRPIGRIWLDSYAWTCPYYLVGSAVAGLMVLGSRYAGWQAVMLILPVVYLIDRSWRLYLGHLGDERNHAEQMSALHLRTIEALALAIEAKDHTTHDHLERVQVYALAIGKELGLSPGDIEALRAAALLHDIGKLAVPEHIISKPGRLTPEEFEKMKIHPVVGAEILEHVQFPYPVVPIVRSHHERWDGSGYPAGLAGEEIPIGARIIAAVDCLDALASDRQYRRALPLDEAMQKVVKLSGTSFDPKVVAVLQRLYVELERTAVGKQTTTHQLSIGVRIARGTEPGAGFEHSNGTPQSAVVPRDRKALFELTQDLGPALKLDEALSVLSVRLRLLIPCDTLAVYLKHEDHLIPKFLAGDESGLFSSLQIPIGQGLSGWVADNRKSIVNGNPSVEPGFTGNSGQSSLLRSALAIPLESSNGVIGVLSLYRCEKDAFNQQDLRTLLEVGPKIVLLIERQYNKDAAPGSTDFGTVFQRLQGAVRAKSPGVEAGALACD